MFGNWNDIEKEGLPKESGYYLVAIERTNYSTKEIYYDTDYIFFRGKTTWARGNNYIRAWMEKPDSFKK